MITAKTDAAIILSIPTRVGNYTFQRVIGQGCMSVVLEATDRSSGKVFAVKVMSRTDLECRKLMNKVMRKVSILKRVQHKHIIHLQQVFARHDLIFIVTENCGGGDLLSWIADGRTRKNQTFKRLFQQIALAVQYLHHQGIAHNDIKAENIVLDSDGNAKLIDFGFAKQSQMVEDEDKCGTLAYAPPEILRIGSYVPQKVDIWSLGILLYAMASGKFPFPTANDKRLKELICEGKLIYPRRMDLKLEALVRSMTTVNPNQRPTIDAVLQDPFFDDLVSEGSSKTTVQANQACLRPIHLERDMYLIFW
jgi:serine/threonine protein kinase